MTRFVLLLAVVLGTSSTTLAAPPDEATPHTKAAEADKAAATLLDTAKVWKAELRLTAEDWKAMQPKGGGPPGFGGPPGGAKPQGFKFTYDFPYVRGTVAFGEDTLDNVGVRETVRLMFPRVPAVRGVEFVEIVVGRCRVCAV